MQNGTQLKLVAHFAEEQFSQFSTHLLISALFCYGHLKINFKHLFEVFALYEDVQNLPSLLIDNVNRNE